MAPNANEKKNRGDYREWLSLIVTLFSIGGVLLVALAVILIGRNTDTAKMVLTATLPLFGAWVGTILAFYFGRENFEAATRCVTEIAKTLSPEEKLKSIPVKEKMRPRNKMLVAKKPAGQIGNLKLVEEILETLTKEQKGDRLPILDDQDHPVYMVHRSAIEQYLVKKALQAPQTKLKDLTLQDLLNDDADLRKLLETST